MDIYAIFGLQFVLTVIVLALMAKWYAAPWLAEKPFEFALTLLIVPHAFRHIGLSFFVPGVVAGPLPNDFATTAAYGDLISALLAILSLVAIRGRWTLAIPSVWLFSVVGMSDLLNALRQTDAVPNFGATWYIPTFLVPLLLVTHVMIFVRLVGRLQKGKLEKDNSVGQPKQIEGSL